jgi:hypothetical protein
MAGERMWVCASREKGKERAGEGNRRGGMGGAMGGGRTVESNFSANTSLEIRRSSSFSRLFFLGGTVDMPHWGSVPCRYLTSRPSSPTCGLSG